MQSATWCAKNMSCCGPQASLGEVACSQAAADAFAKFERQSNWLSIKRVCQEHLLPVNELCNLVKQATDQTMEGRHICI